MNLPFPLRPLLLAAILCTAGLQFNAREPGRADAGYPRGAAAIPLLREIWKTGFEKIHPAGLARRFDAETLARLEARLRARDDVALADVLNPFLESLGVSHTRFYDRRHQTYYFLRSLFATRDPDAPRLYTTGMLLDDGHPGLVRAVMEGSPAEAAGVRRGGRIVRVDGAAFQSLLQWQHDGEIRLTLDRQGRSQEVRLRPIRQGFPRALARATAASASVIDCGSRRLGYLHLWSGTRDLFLDALTGAVADAKKEGLDGFVLDLRDGYGGAWFPYLDPFFPDRDQYFTATAYSREGSTTIHAEPQVNPDAWNGPLAVIVNGGTRSGKESLAYQFRKTGRAKLFGSRTRGAFTGGLGVFTDREADYVLYLSVSEMRLDGVVVEGVGVSPDVALPETADDAPLAAALQDLGCGVDPLRHS